MQSSDQMKTDPPRISCIQTIGIRPTQVTIEVSSHFQVPQLLIIGLPSTEIGEAKERVRSAVLNSGFEFPNRRVIVNLSPAFLSKSGTGMDLAIALGILIKHSSEKINFRHILAWGELSLAGEVQLTPHTLHAVYQAFIDPSIDLLILPRRTNLSFHFIQALVKRYPDRTHSLRIILGTTLRETFQEIGDQDGTLSVNELLKQLQPTEPTHKTDELISLPSSALTRILGATLAGEHHLMMLGPKGIGKSHSIEIISKCFENHSEESLVDRALTSDLYPTSETAPSAIRFVGVQVKPQALQGSFRGSKFKPGECSLAHGGLLIGDEFPEWSRDSKECLRHPLERGSIPINRVDGSFEAPAQFQFIASGNLCPCGGSPWESPPSCLCKLPEKERYRAKLSGPILDRIDFFILVRKQEPEGVTRVSEFKRKVESVKKRLLENYPALPSRWSGDFIEQDIKPRLKPELTAHLEKIHSMRSEHKAIRTAHTLSAWDGEAVPRLEHIVQAIQLRPEQWV